MIAVGLKIVLCRIVQNAPVNMMTARNIAIVFGPTLIRPRPEDVMCVHTVMLFHV